MQLISNTNCFTKKNRYKKKLNLKSTMLAALLFIAFSNSYCLATTTKPKDSLIVAGQRVKDINTKLDGADASQQTGAIETYSVYIKDNEKAKFDAKLPDTSNAEINYARKLSHKLAGTIKYSVNGKKDIIPPQDNISYERIKENLNLWLGFSYNVSRDRKDEDNTDPTNGSYVLVSFGGDTLTPDKITLGFAYSFAMLDIDVKGALDNGNIKANHKIHSHIIASYAAFDLNVINANFSILHAFGTNEKKDLSVDIEPYKSGILGLGATIESPMKVKSLNIDIGTHLGLDIASVKAHGSKHQTASTKGNKNLVPEQSNSLLTIEMYTAVKDQYNIDENIKFNYKVSLGYKYIATFGKTSMEFGIPTGKATNLNSLTLKTRETDRHTALLGVEFNFEAHKNVSIGLNSSFEIGTGLAYGAGLIGRYIF